MAFFSMPQGYILMKLWLKIFLSKFSFTFIFWCSLFALINNSFEQIEDYFLLESSEMDCKKGQ